MPTRMGSNLKWNSDNFNLKTQPSTDLLFLRSTQTNSIEKSDLAAKIRQQPSASASFGDANGINAKFQHVITSST